MNSNRALLTGFAAFTWLVLVSLAYVYTHKPFSPETFVALILAIWRLTLGALILLAAGGLGRRMARGFHDKPFLHMAFGLGGVAFLVFAASVLGLLSPIALGILLGLVLLGNARHALEVARAGWQSAKDLWPEKGLARWIALTCLGILLLNLPQALTPPVQFDTLVYHLTLPQEYLRAGKLVYLPEIMFWGMPQLTEMLYLLAMALGGPTAALTFGWLLGAATLLGLLDYLGNKYGKTAGWLGIAALLAGFTLSSTLSWGYVEWILIFYGLAWLMALEAWLETRRETWLILAAALAGLALGTKYTAGLLALIQVLLVLSWPGQSIAQRLRSVALTGGFVFALSAIWWIKNLAFTGNPFYPLLFPAGDMDALRLDFYQNIPTRTALWDSLTLPWHITIWGVEGKAGPSATIGPLMLAFSALAWLGWEKTDPAQKKHIRLAALVSVVGFVVWGIASQRNALMIQPRLFTSLFPAWAALASAGYAGLEKLRAGMVRFGQVGLAVALMFASFNLLESAQSLLTSRALEAGFGVISEKQYTQHHLGSYQQASETLLALPQGSKAVLLWETRGYACLPVCDPDEIIDRWYHDRRMYVEVGGVLAAWQAQGYTHLLVSEPGAKFVETEDGAKFNPDDWQTLRDLRQRLGEGQKAAPGYTLYALPPSQP